MLKRIIVIENGKNYQFDTEKELVEKLLGDNYYHLSNDEKRELLKIKAIANSINNNMEILESQDYSDIYNNYILINEKTYILSLLISGNITLLERVDSEIFTGTLDKSKFTKNYIIVNNFAKQILEQMIEER